MYSGNGVRDINAHCVFVCCSKIWAEKINENIGDCFIYKNTFYDI